MIIISWDFHSTLAVFVMINTLKSQTLASIARVCVRTHSMAKPFIKTDA